MAANKISHSYPHCWRCKQPVIFRATDQWFVSMAATHLREAAMREIDRVEWIPGWSINRMAGMVGRPSRLVHQPPARVGRADPGVRVRRMRRDRRDA